MVNKPFECPYGVTREPADVITDICFLIFFFLDIVVLTFIACRSFARNKTMINLANILLISFLIATLVNRLFCLVFTVVFDCNQDITRNTVQMWIYVELPFALINAASIVVFFEWTQIADFITTTRKQSEPQITKQ